jgi:uncharacterized protein (DUF927 family)
LEAQKLSEIEILDEKNLKSIIGNESKEMEFRMRARELKIVGIFEKKLKIVKQKSARAKMEHMNFCQFDKEKHKIICTGAWIATPEGIYKQIPNNETGEVDIVEASRMQIIPTETYNNIDTNTEKVKIEFCKHGQWHKLVTEKSTISVLNKIVELSNNGIDVNSLNSKDLMEYLYDVLTLNDNTIIPNYRSVSRLGWVGKDFMPYSKDIKFDGENDYKYLFDCIKSNGTLKEWIDYIKPLRKNIYFRMIMAASFASPLIQKLNALPFVFNIWGGTGTGKSVALLCAMSIWGDPSFGKLTKTMDMTINSMMNTAGFLHNLPFAGDELQTIKKQNYNYDQIIMKVCEGVERARMKYNKVSETQTWKCSFIFTAEEPCTRSNSGGGTKNRVIEVEAKTVVCDNGNDVVAFIVEHYGNAGKVFIDYIKNLDLQERYKEIHKYLLEKCETTEKQSMSMALMLLADQLAGEVFFGEEEKMKKSDIKLFLMSKDEVDISKRAYVWFIDWIATNHIRFESNNLGENWGSKDDEICTINRQVLESGFEKNKFDITATLSKWDELGYIVRNSQNRYTHQTKCHGIKANYVKVILKNPFEVLPNEEME